MKRGIYHAAKFFGLIILDLGVNVHSRLAVFVSGEILNRLGIDAGIQKIGDVGVTQLMWRHIKIYIVNNVRVVLLMTSQSWVERASDSLPIYIFVIYSFFRSPDGNIFPNSLKL